MIMARLTIKTGANAKFPQSCHRTNGLGGWELVPKQRRWMTLVAGEEEIDVDLGWADEPTGEVRARTFAESLGLKQIDPTQWERE